MTESPTASLRPSAPNVELLENLIEEITNKLQAGESVESEAYAAQYPEYAGQIRDLLPALRVLADASQNTELPGAPAGQPGLLGDFRILREVGRGGMGVVYEAEQISLGRRVALKVLPFAATMDPRQLLRFQNEARSAASLEHPHIVPVYGVGSERGVHYYAMKFIDGQSMATLITQQRSVSASAKQASGGRQPPDAASPASASNQGAYAPRSPDAARSPESTTTPAAARTERAPRDAAYFRRAAEWGIQAAEALEHAHSLGIVHRDIKPANLIIDGQGKLWVTDFGLARTASPGGDAGGTLTMTGDLLGTLRYMSPEQALAKHGLVDHRTDVYSLGVTLYELLTLRPAFGGEDRAHLLQAIGLEEPTSPRRIDWQIPAELETIVLKAMEKNAGDRYGTAIEMGQDLRRFLEDQPIQARRPTLVQRARKWGRRHKAVVWAVALGLVVAVPALAGSTAWAFYKQGQTEDALEIADGQRRAAQASADEAQRQSQRADENFRQAITVVDGLVRKADDPKLSLEEVRKRQSQAAVEFFERLVVENREDPEGRWQTFLAYRGIMNSYLILKEFAKAADAFDKCLDLGQELVTDFPDQPRYAQALADLKMFECDHQITAPSDEGYRLSHAGRFPEAVQCYRLALRNCERFASSLRPEDSAIRRAETLGNLSYALWSARQSKEAEDGLTEAMAAWAKLADDPEAMWPPFREAKQAQAQARRGQIRVEDGRLEDADRDFRQALERVDRLPPNEQATAVEHGFGEREHIRSTLGNLLWATDRRNEAADCFRQAEEDWRKAADNPVRNHFLARFLATCPDAHFREPAEAVQLATKAVDKARAAEVGTYWEGTYTITLGIALYRAGDWQAAAQALRKGADLRKASEATDLFFLAMATWHLGDKDQARKWYDKAVAWMEKNQPRNEELRRFRAEAAELMEIDDKQKQ
jgi:serine/threonine protein kinase